MGTRDGRTQSARAWLFFSLHLDGLKTPIYTQTTTPTLPFTPNPSPKKPNFRSHASPIRSRDSWVSGLRQTDAAPFFCCCRVAAFGSQDLSSRTSINGHWVSGPRLSGPGFQDLGRRTHATHSGSPGPGPGKNGIFAA